MPQTRAHLSKLDANTQPKIEISKNSAGEIDGIADEQRYFFNGTLYPSYEELVKAKRKRNAEVLAKSGLLDVAVSLSNGEKKPATTRGIRPTENKKRKEITDTIRRSNRLAGIQSDGIYIEEERSGINVKVGGVLSDVTFPKKETHYKDRVNDGSDLTVQNAIQLCDSKWRAESLICSSTTPFFHNFVGLSKQSAVESLTSRTMTKKIQALSVDDPKCVSKVVPDRIYSVGFHPSPHKLIVVAGDKLGYVGFWDVDNPGASDDNANHSDGVHLIKLYNRPVSNLEWSYDGTKLLTSSYDGSVRLFDVEKQVFSEVFATYDDSDVNKNKLGFGLDIDGRYWVQYVTFDPRNDQCLFLSTSFGDVLHVDLRDKAHVSFNQQLSDKKINTVSLHPNGYTMATAGLDCILYLWDIRRFHSDSKGPIATARSICSKSINSAFFSPSGKNIITTTQANTLDIFTNAHTATNLISMPTHRIRHDNQTGRWLSTFMARWHPIHTNEEIFVVGSMQHPRTLEVFDAARGELVRGIRGESMTSVLSRCCMHPSENELIVAGGNSSGRVVIAR